ncbi:MAG: hypothetical protein OMM_04415 [Candidatus Magnetoglobus multicellularis str. Araruama]|uniref:Uncharacterized protein n=1 Tax=Candidatus Magnetoglobus multicellularis str. Araruama TaxID=890399 RepID=A0A1V1P1E7_9BACT|nr:MAG: hypothetical protein OMM_04415 [Candidatus Magnetoglobus multicellularis str. Araruama]
MEKIDKISKNKTEALNRKAIAITKTISKHGLPSSEKRTYNNRVAPTGEKIIKHQMKLAEKRIRKEIEKVTNELVATQKFYARKLKTKNGKVDKASKLRQELYFFDKLVKQTKTATKALKVLAGSLESNINMLERMKSRGLLETNIQKTHKRMARNVERSLTELLKKGAFNSMKGGAVKN